MEAQGVAFPESEKCDLYIASMGDDANLECAKLATALRADGVNVQFDVVGRSVKAQMKYANKIGAAFTMVLGDSELESGRANLKNMETGEQQEVSLTTFCDDFMLISIKESLKDLEEIGGDDGFDFSSIISNNI